MCAQRFGESERLLARWHAQVAPTLPREQQRLEVAMQLLHGDLLDLRALDWVYSFEDGFRRCRVPREKTNKPQVLERLGNLNW